MVVPGLALEEMYTRRVVQVTCGILNLLGFSSQAFGRTIFANGFSVEVLNGCNGLEAMLIYLAAVFSYPSTVRAKFWAVALGFPFIQVINLLRIIGLVLVGLYFPTFFHETHVFVAQALIIFMVGALWLVWITYYVAPQPS